MKQIRTQLTLALGLACAGLLGCSGTSGDPGGSGGNRPAVIVQPGSVSLDFGATKQFQASVRGLDDPGVTWKVEPSTGGGIDEAGLYTAPSMAGTFKVVATSVANPKISGHATVVVSQPSSIDPSGFLAADRATVWNPGMMALGGIPARTQVCATVPPSDSDPDAITAAIKACPEGQVVQLTEGTYTINGGRYLLLNKGITLRGAGPGRTILQKTDGAVVNQEAPGPHNSPLIMIAPNRFPSRDGTVSANFTADGDKGTYAVTVDDASTFQAGEVVLVDERSGAVWMDDPAGRGRILASPDWRVVWQLHDPPQNTDDPIHHDGSTIGDGNDAASWFSRQDRPTAEVKKIERVEGNTITFSTPLHIGYRASHQAQVTRFPNDPYVSGVGVEDLTVTGGDNGNIRINRAAESWVRGVDNAAWHGEGFYIAQSFRIEIRDFYVHDAVWAQPGGAGYAISLSHGSAEILIENGISVRANKVMVARSAGAGSVVGYNYMDMGYIRSVPGWIEVGLNASHMVGPHHVLFEGNYGFNADSDKTHGNSIYHTFFRNQLRGLRAPFHNQRDGALIDDLAQDGGPQRCAGLNYYSYWMSFVGNVMGAPGLMDGWKYETTFGQGPGIWMLGWDDFSPNPIDSKVIDLTLRHGNYDYVTSSVHWDPEIADHDLPSSLYLTHKPAFFGDMTWPWVDPTGAQQLHTLPAKARYDAGTPFAPP